MTWTTLASVCCSSTLSEKASSHYVSQGMRGAPLDFKVTPHPNTARPPQQIGDALR